MRSKVPADPFVITQDGLMVAVRLTPKGGRDAVDGVETLGDGRAVLKARVRAAPSEGEANTALVRLLARALDVAPRRVSVVAGTTARVKRVLIEGDGAELAAALRGITGQDT